MKNKRKRNTRVALLLLSVIFLYAVIALMPRPKNYKGDNPFMKGEGGLPDIIAHRGGADEFPENTLEAYYNAYSISENIIMETDLNITKDGVLILLHDTRLDATTNVVGLASEWTYSDLVLERVDFGYDNPTEDCILSGERARFTVDGEERYPTDVSYPEGVSPRDEKIFGVTTFEELITAFPTSRISAEIKQDGDVGVAAAREAIRIVTEHGAEDRVLLASFHGEVTRELRRASNIKYSPNIIGIAGFFALHTLGLDALYLEGVATLQLPMEEMGFTFAKRGVVRRAHLHDLPVHYWTADDEDEMRSLIEIGADGIMTDNPSKLKEILDSYTAYQ